MQTRSAAFDNAVRFGGKVTQRVTVLRAGAVRSLPAAINVLPGSKVTIDRTAAVRRSLDLKIGDTTGLLVPKTPSDPLAPFGNEIAVSVGFTYANGTVEVLPQGVFVIETVQSDTEGNVQITGRDRSSVISLAVLEDPYALTAGQALETAIQNALALRYPGTLTFLFSSTGVSVPATATAYQEGQDIWQAMMGLANANGFELFFDVLGRCVLQPIPNPLASTSVWAYSPGVGSIVIDEQDTLTSDGVVNVIVVIGEGGGAAAPVKAKAVVSDASSPIYPQAPFGRRPQIVNDSTITTQGQAQNAANQLLLAAAGSGEVLGFDAAPHPAHDPGDVVQLTSTQLGLNTFVVLNGWDLDLGLAKQAQYATLGRRSS